MSIDYPIVMACGIARFTFVRDYLVKQHEAFRFVDPNTMVGLFVDGRVEGFRRHCLAWSQFQR